MRDFHVDPVRKLAAAKGVGRWVPVANVVAIYCGCVMVFLGSKTLGKTDAVEVLGIKIADCGVPAFFVIEIAAHAVGRFQRIALAGAIRPDDPGDFPF